MEMMDFTGKLNNHKAYIKMLEKIEFNTNYIEVVILDGKKTNDLVEKFRDNIIEIKKVSKWWGTEIKGSNYLYRISYSKELFNYLREFETFTKYYEYGSDFKSFSRGDYCEITDFGIDDIAFYDNNDKCLLCTTTHEGYIMVNKKII